MNRSLPLAILLSLALMDHASAQAPADPSHVWVNTRSGVYHCPGTEHYGKTTQGEYLSEAAARGRGYRANGGRACGPLRAADGGAAGGTPAPRGLVGGSVPDSAPAAPVPPTQPCVVTKVTDGDTIACEGLGSVRLIGVDAPENDQEPFGTAATAGLASLVALGATIQLEKDAVERDQYGRLLAYLWFEGRQINWLLIRQGWAVALPYDTTRRYEQALAAAEQRAEAESRGLWRVNGFQCRPEDRRKKRC